jgi:hypothetical protein
VNTHSTTLPADFPPLRAAAEEAAREFMRADPACVEGNYTSEHVRSVARFAVLLADLTRPASRDYWARWWHRETPRRLPRAERDQLAAAYREDAAALRLALVAAWRNE